MYLSAFPLGLSWESLGCRLCVYLALVVTASLTSQYFSLDPYPSCLRVPVAPILSALWLDIFFILTVLVDM